MNGLLPLEHDFLVSVVDVLEGLLISALVRMRVSSSLHVRLRQVAPLLLKFPFGGRGTGGQNSNFDF